MICRKGSNVLTAKTVIITKQKGEQRNAFLVTAIVMGACIASLKIIQDNLTAAGNHIMLLLGIAILICVFRWVVEEYIKAPCVEKLREDTRRYAKDIHILDNNELINCLIINNYCPDIRNVYLQDNNSVGLKGIYTMHFIEFGQNGAVIYSEKHDYRADKEAYSIIRFMAESCA